MILRHIGDPEPRAVVESSTLPAVLREYPVLPGQFAAEALELVGWSDPLPGAEHGDVVYAVTKGEWTAG